MTETDEWKTDIQNLLRPYTGFENVVIGSTTAPITTLAPIIDPSRAPTLSPPEVNNLLSLFFCFFFKGYIITKTFS